MLASWQVTQSGAQMRPLKGKWVTQFGRSWQSDLYHRAIKPSLQPRHTSAPPLSKTLEQL